MISSNDCPICFVPYNNDTRFPMIVGECGHTICKSCSQGIKVCPICRKQVKPEHLIKNFAMVDKVQSKYRKNPQKPEVELNLADMERVHEDVPPPKMIQNSPVECPNGHQCLWRGQVYKCAKCLKYQYFGWHCLQCKFCKCDDCAKTVFTDRMCPNGHKTTWQGQISLGARPYKLPKPDFLTQNYSYQHRKACSNNKFYKDQGNRNAMHPVVYNLPDNRKPKIGGWVCNQCLYIRCKQCATVEYQKEICPNGHKTTWFGEDKECAKCGEVLGGWRCEQCKFYLCDKCVDANGRPTEVPEYAKRVEGNTKANCCMMM